MPETDDISLLREFAEADSEPAFTELVSRHLNLVYSAALRSTGNPHAAQEISQAVFILLARKAKGFSAKVVLSGWLYQTTRLTAANWLRGEIRRQKREEEAYMQSTLNEPAPETWPQIAPLLEDAMGRLGQRDRDAIVLRYFENKSLVEVGAAIGASEDAAKMRVNRALEKLRNIFAKHGADLTTAAGIAEAISANSVHTAPVGLVKTISAVAIAKGAAASASTLTLVKGAATIMAWSTKTTIVAGAAALLAISTATVAVKTIYFPAIKDVYFQPNYSHLQSLPRGLFVLRPTHFNTPTNGLDYSAEDSSPSGEHVTLFMGRHRSFEQVINKAYGGSPAYTVYPADLPKGNFDYLCTILDSRAGEHLQTAIKRKLGYTASWQQRDTDVFLLQVKTADPPSLKASNPANRPSVRPNSRDQLIFQNWPSSGLAYEIERTANVPVVDKTGLAGTFDFTLDCSQADLAGRDWNTVNRALGELGLELVPTNMPMNVLVVEKAK
jgi:uncharacterized protein (TIGR03435 family)